MVTIRGKRLSAASMCGAMALALTAAPPAGDAMAQAYPERPIRIVATSTPGAGPDVISRLLADRLSQVLGQPIVVDNRPGAAGTIGADMVSRATPDGYTLMIMTAQHVIASTMYDLKYRLDRDFASVALIGTVPFLLLVNPKLPVHTVNDLIKVAKSQELRYGTGGAGSPPHLSAAIFTHMTGTTMQHIPYKGITPAINDTASGQVHLAFAVIPASMPLLDSKRVRAIGITTQKASPLLPQVPPIADSVPGYEMIGWYSVIAPAGTPARILDRLSAELVKTIKEPKFRERLVGLGTEPIGGTRQDLDRFRREQSKLLINAVKVSGAARSD
jgi:tripartite-type tricarboxylate transporter receptor subunit TctC